ncbi:putative beta-carotene isomerase [Helianthus annuus]|uniref:Beta-carotene isomerase n=1 Tax=Helianthus annuus TaxID=4232 RepID=A0A251S9A1_HELAN|nr:beta-carotene isomerase D27, chloroplastic [Helianthus annuus]KAF5762982.1 putative beta-carotene isomerase [Helianthus annuus]KAJ0449964.1 putative beta-carotene isomerase [Helianthus annuus]KAJ0471688.1 putative beta-carotene isomerase [Helianthus annuus]
MGTTIPLSPARVFSFPARSHRKPPHICPKHGPSTLSLLIPPTSITTKHSNDHHSLKIDTTNNYTTATSSKTVYRDNWLESIAIAFLSKTIQETAGIKDDTPGYKGIVSTSAAVFRELSPNEQRAFVLKVLEKAVPSFSLIMIKKMRLMPNSKFTREFFAIFTTVAFRWLVGPSEVRELEFEGKKERNVVHITKCRFLEEGNCVGMCTNLCKMPTQEFIKKSFGIPVNMVPNFDDMSCEIIFGQDPPAQEDDPAFKEPCYKLCNLKQRHTASCIN